jgi:hypothetical protein
VTIGEQFLWGCVGSLAVEIVKIHWLYGTARRLPARYGSPVFWIARSLLALTGGGLAVAYRIETPVLALHLGAATPLIIQALAQNVGRLLAEQDEDRDAQAVRRPGKSKAPRESACPQCRQRKPKVTRLAKSKARTTTGRSCSALKRSAITIAGICVSVTTL